MAGEDTGGGGAAVTVIRKLLLTCCLASGLATAAAPVSYVLGDTEVRDVHARALNRDYQVFVALPESYRSSNLNKVR